MNKDEEKFQGIAADTTHALIQITRLFFTCPATSPSQAKKYNKEIQRLGRYYSTPHPQDVSSSEPKNMILLNTN
jgi:hypothetical protein